MAIMMGKLYVALRTANVPEDQARGAAEEIAVFETLRLDISDLRGKVNVLTAMVGVVITLLLAGFGKLIFGH
jgi:hypothetical protein